MSQFTLHQHPKEDTGFLLWKLSRVWKKNINACLEPHDLTHVQYLVLVSLQGRLMQGLITTQQDLATDAAIDKMMASKVINTLIQKGLVSKVRDSRDRRAFQLQLTDQGTAAIANLRSEVSMADQKFFESVTINKFSIASILKSIWEAHEPNALK